MSEYFPDKWLLLKMSECYKVFGVWSGGYLSSGSWQLNSGITKVDEDGDYYIFHGVSGSTYKCHKEGYGSNVYGYSIIDKFRGNVTVFEDIREAIEEIKKL